MSRRTIACLSVPAVALIALTVAVAQPGRPPRRRPGRAPANLSNEPVAKDAAEKKILDVLDDMDRNQRRGMMNVPKEDGRLLRVLCEAAGAKHVVEVGTSNGYSGIWLCLGLRNTGGTLTTYEIDEHRAGLARQNFRRAGVDKMVTLVQGDAHEEIVKLDKPVDLVFLDADKQGYMDYLKKLLPRLRPGGLILAHNVRSHGGAMAPFLEAVTENKDLETVFLHMQGSGISVTLKKR